ncbi:MAG TPA: GNAT family N-acetyltransferase [Candidatus Hydrogenedentes bacterium]|nr:GNAT family N-acetyltransferase [Candidatus Hydrogenedentota bacterium]
MSVRLSGGHLDVVAATLELVRAELESPERLALLLNARVDLGWPPGEYDRDAQLFFRDRLDEGGAEVVGWYCWYALRHDGPHEPPVLVGAGGYLGPPDKDGVVEIGLSIMPSWRNCGYATELARLLVENAFADSRVRKVIAHTAPANVPACRLLEKCGFAAATTDEAGNVLYEIPRDPQA